MRRAGRRNWQVRLCSAPVAQGRAKGAHERDRRRVREAGGLDEHVVELLVPLHEVAERLDEVTAHGAADATGMGGSVSASAA